MTIGVVGVNHHAAPIHIREGVAFTESKRIEGSNLLLDLGILEVIILSTCNRSEIYFHCENIEEHLEVVISFYKTYFNVEGIEDYLFSKVNQEAVNHLFRVSAGLDSIVLGEDQILGQVKEAHELAMDLGASKKVFNRLFRQGIEVAKVIKCQTKISQQPLSISYIAVKFLREEVGTFKNKKILVIGTGEMSLLALKYFIDEENTIYLANRNIKKTEAIQSMYPQIISVNYEDRYKMLQDVDMVLSATGAPHVIIKAEKMPLIHKPLVIMDIALPRDIDSKIGKMDYVRLYDMDVLKNIQFKNENKRKELSFYAQEIINKEAAEFFQWLTLARVDPTLKSLNDRCLEIKDDSMDYLNRKLDLSAKEKQLVDWVITSALKRVMREPIVNLKQIKDEGKREDFVKAIEELFNV